MTIVGQISEVCIVEAPVEIHALVENAHRAQSTRPRSLWSNPFLAIREPLLQRRGAFGGRPPGKQGFHANILV